MLEFKPADLAHHGRLMIVVKEDHEALLGYWEIPLAPEEAAVVVAHLTAWLAEMPPPALPQAALPVVARR